MKKHHEKKAKGGGIEQPPSEEQTNKKKTEKDLHADEYEGKNRAERVVKEEKAHGGKVHEKKKHERMKRKAGGHVPGKESMPRLDKRARGGAAKSPLSGADAPNLGYATGHAASETRGKGMTIKP